MIAPSSPRTGEQPDSVTPVISVLMTVYNREATVRQAVESIIAQQFIAWELIVVDDGSTDGTVATLRSFSDPRVHLDLIPHRGRAAALNRALFLSRGEWIAIADSDDTSMPERLATLHAEAKKRPEVGIIGSFYSTVDQHGRVMQKGRLPQEDEDIRALMPVSNSLCFCSSMLHRTVFDAVGQFDESLRAAVDYEFLLRCLPVTRLRTVALPLVALQRPPDAMGRQMYAEQRHNSYRVARIHLEEQIRRSNQECAEPHARELPLLQLGRLAYYHDDLPAACDALRAHRKIAGTTLPFLRYYIPARYMAGLLRLARRIGVASHLTAPFRALSRRNRFFLP
jgi:glycosyltransferase involved in cell wall biosynthesis